MPELPEVETTVLDLKNIIGLSINKIKIYRNNIRYPIPKKITTLTDCFIICTSESEPQTRAIYNHIKDELLKHNLKPSNIEGYEQMKWILIDYINPEFY